MSKETVYVPGVCNINPAQIQRRRNIGYIGLTTLVLLCILYFALQLPSWLGIVLFFPTFLAATGFLQAKNKFCVGYASAGMRHTGANSETIEDATAINKDKQRARAINTQVIVIATLVTAALIVISSLL